MKIASIGAPDNTFILDQTKSLPQEPIKEEVWLEARGFRVSS